MIYEVMLRDFVRRTRENLELTERWRQGHPEFSEVTHLINSLLGFLVLPRQEILGYMRGVRIVPTGILEWRVWFRLEGGEPRPKNLSTLVIGLRNAVAHNSFDFSTDDPADPRNITGVIFQACTKDGSPLWRAIFTLAELHAFLGRLTDEVEWACENRARLEREAEQARQMLRHDFHKRRSESDATVASD